MVGQRNKMKDIKLIMENWRGYIDEEQEFNSPFLNEEDILEEGPVKLTAKNFPAENNENFSGAGERTQYASQEGVTFPFLQDSVAKIESTGELVKIPSGTNVVFLPPYKLFRGEDIGITGKGKKSIFAPADIEGLEPGYVVIGHIEKPSGQKQSRVSLGAKAQDQIKEIVIARAAEDGVQASYVSSATPGSTKPDLVIDYGGEKIQFEIKNRQTKAGFTTMFDKSVKRGPAPEIIEDLAKAFIDNLEVSYDDVENQKLSDALKVNNFPPSFQGVMDFFNAKIDQTIGYAGDEGVVSSGKLPSAFTTKDPNILNAFKNVLVEHLNEGGDDYFVIYTASANEADIYSTGGSNPLGAVAMPDLLAAKLATYGGKSSGSTRVGLKIKFAPMDSNLEAEEQND